MATKTKPAEQADAEHDPAALHAQADRLTAEAEQARQRAEAERRKTEAEAFQREREHWRERISGTLTGQRERFDAAWQRFVDAAASGDGAEAIAAWIAFKRTRAQVAAELKVLRPVTARLNLRDLTPPRMVPGMDQPVQRSFAAAFDAVADSVEVKAQQRAQAELQAEVARVAQEAQAAAAHGAPDADLGVLDGPGVTFRSTDPDRVVSLTDGRTVRFVRGTYTAHEGVTARALRQAIHSGALRDVAEVETTAEHDDTAA